MKFTNFFTAFDNFTELVKPYSLFIDLLKHLTKEIRIEVIFINVAVTVTNFLVRWF